MAPESVVGMLAPFGGEVARAYERIGALSAEFANARGEAARTALAAPANAQWAVKMYKRLQMALVVDERQVITNRIIAHCKGAHNPNLEMQVPGSVDVSSDIDATFLGTSAPLAVACASKAFLLAVAPIASAVDAQAAPHAFLSSGAVYDVNFYGQDYFTPSLPGEERLAKLERHAKAARDLYALSWGASPGGSAFYEARASLDSMTWLIAHLAFENPEQAEGLFRNTRAADAPLNLEWLKPANDPRMVDRSPTAYAAADTVGHVFEYTPYGLATEEYQQAAPGAAAQWGAMTQAVYRTRARDFRRLLKKMHYVGVGIAGFLRIVTGTVCEQVAARLNIPLPRPGPGAPLSPCKDMHSELMRLTMNIMYAEALRLAEYMDGKAVASVARDKATPDRTRKAILKPETVKELGLAQAFRKLALLVAPEAYSSQGAIFDVVGSQIAGDGVQLPVFPLTSYVESMAENAFHVLFKKPSNIADPQTYRPGMEGGLQAYAAFRGVMGDDLKRGGKYLARWAYALSLVDKEAFGLPAPTTVPPAVPGAAPRFWGSRLFMRSPAGLGEVLKHGCLPSQLHRSLSVQGEGGVSSEALGTSFDGAFESQNTPQLGGRFAAQGQLVVERSLAFEFVSRGPALKAASKSPDVSAVALLDMVSLALDPNTVLPGLAATLAETTMAAVAEALSFQLTSQQCWLPTPPAGDAGRLQRLLRPDPLVVGPDESLLKPECSLSFDYSAFTNSGLAPCSERACSIGPLADSATFVNYMSVVQELAIARLPVHLGTPGVGDAPAADDAAWLQEVRAMFPDPRALRAADADMQGGEGRSASSRLRSSSRQHPLLPAQQ